MQLPKRASDPGNSPFGVILSRKDNSSTEVPFEGWEYKPEYFKSWSFHIGENSLQEPLCIYMPFIEPGTLNNKVEASNFKSITQVSIHTPLSEFSNVVNSVKYADRIKIIKGSQHLMEVVFDGHQQNEKRDFRPKLPLIVYW